jgi:hypothetical protein
MAFSFRPLALSQKSETDVDKKSEQVLGTTIEEKSIIIAFVIAIIE